MASWKNVGGINYNSRNQYVRASNIKVDTIVAAESIGKKDTTAYVEGDLFFQPNSRLYSTRNEIDSNGLYIHYPFNVIDTQEPDYDTGELVFFNKSLNPNIDPTLLNLRTRDSITQGGVEVRFADKSPQLFVDVSYGNTLHLQPQSVMLHSDASFNPSAMIDNDIFHDEFKALTLNCWIYIETPAADLVDTGFLLFGLDTENLDNTFSDAAGRDRIDGQIDHLDPSFYFFVPGYGHNSPQIYWTEDVSNAYLQGETRASAKSNIPIVYDSWNMMTLVIRNREVEIYRNSVLTDVFKVSGRMPNNKQKLIINSNRFFDLSNNSWTTSFTSSQHDVKIIDYKIFNYAVHPDYISILYKHYSELSNIRTSNFAAVHSKTAYNFLIDSSFSLLNSTLLVQGDVVSIGKHEVFNKQTVYGPSEIVNDLYVSGDVGVGLVNPSEKLDVLGNIKSSGNLFLGFEDISVNGIYFKGYTGDDDPAFKHSSIEERFYIDAVDGDLTFPYNNQPDNTELLIFKGNDVHPNRHDPLSISADGSITDASFNNTQGDRIRIKAPQILFDTYQSSLTNIGTDSVRYEELHRMIFDQSGNLGINVIYPKQRLDVRGKINLQTDDRYDISSNIYIANTADPDPKVVGMFNTGIGGNIFTSSNFNSSNNVAVGYSSQKNIISGFENTTVGYNSLKTNSTGNYVTAIGAYASEISTVNSSTSVGYKSQNKNTTGEYNTSLGYQSLKSNSTGSGNTGIGYLSLEVNTQSFNTALGAYSLNTSNSSNNTAIGYKSQTLIDGGQQNTTIGSTTLEVSTGGDDNVAIGYQSMNNKIGDRNVSTGSQSLQLNSTGNDNTAIGYFSMNNTTGSNAVAVGNMALTTSTVDDNVAIGHSSQKVATSATGNVSVGARTLIDNTIGSENVAIGHESQTSYTGDSDSHNTTVGHETLHDNLTGKYNTALGRNALRSVTSTDASTALGCNALTNNTSGENLAIGSNALFTNTTGAENLSIGNKALFLNNTSSGSLAIGNYALSNNTTSYNMAIGHNSQLLITTGENNVTMGYQTLAASNTSANSIAIGYRAQENTLDSSNNIAIGSYTLRYTQPATNDNICIGYEAMMMKRYGSKNISVGSYSFRKEDEKPERYQGDSNVAIGYESMFDTTGNYNIGIGDKSLRVSSTDSNIAIGFESQLNLDTGSQNLSIGYRTLAASETGNYNVAIGHESQYRSSSASNNTAVGYRSLYDVFSAHSNTAVGREALTSCNLGVSNVGVGMNAGYSNATGSRNNAVGYDALYTNQDGMDNIAIGNEALYSNLSGDGTIAIGFQSAFTQRDASGNIAIGYLNSYSNNIFPNNLSIGNRAQYNSKSVNNTSYGHYCMFSQTTGSHNTGMGYFSLYKNISGSYNVSIGYENMYEAEYGNYNLSLGYQALSSDSTTGNAGDYNIALGFRSLYDNNGGDFNVSIGYESLYSNQGGSDNIALGTRSSYKNEDGNDNVSMGNSSLYANLSGSYNIGIGQNSLYSHLSDNSIAIGYNSQYKSTDGYSNLSIGTNSLYQNTEGINNIAFGHSSQQNTNSNISDAASDNISLGNYSMSSNSTGARNISIGSYALRYNYNNDYNIAIGYESLNMTYGSSSSNANYNLQSANANTAIGYQSMKEHYTNGTESVVRGNTAVGYQAMMEENNGIYNNALGNQALYDLANDSHYNVGIGSQALYKGKRNKNVAIGFEALKSDAVRDANEAIANIAIGHQSSHKVTTGSYNTSIGISSQITNTTGDYNLSIGAESLYANDSGTSNIAFGNKSLYENVTQDNNIAIGDFSLQNNNQALLNSNNNIAIGYNSLTSHIQGSQNTYLGNYSGEYDISGVQNTVVGYTALRENIDGKGNTVMGHNAGADCKGDYNIMIGYQASAPNGGFDTTDDLNGFGEFVNTSIAIGYQSKVNASDNIAIGTQSEVNFTTADVDGSVAIGTNSYVSKRRSMAIGVDASANLHENMIVIGETIPFKWLKHDHATNPSYNTDQDKYYNYNSTRTFNDTVKVCIGTTDNRGIDGKDYKFRLDGSANITGDLKVDGNLMFSGDTIETVDHQIVRFSEQLDISNTGIAPALKITQYGSGDSSNDYEYREGSIVEVYDGDDENNGDPLKQVFHIKNGGNSFFRNNLDVSRNMIIYNKNSTNAASQDPNEADPEYNHVTINSYPGDNTNHNNTLQYRETFGTTTVDSAIVTSYQNYSRPEKYLPDTSSTIVSGTNYKVYDFSGGRDGKGQYTLEVSGNVFVHNYMKIESNRGFENSFEVHTTDGIQLPAGSTADRPGNYYYHAKNPDANINDSIYPKVSPDLDTSTQVYQVNNYTGNSSDGSIRYNTDTNQCEVYAGGRMWTGLAGYKTEQPPYFLKQDLGQSQVASSPIRHNANNLSVQKTFAYIDTAWEEITTVYYDSFTGLPYPLYHYTIIDISTNSGWQLFKVMNGNVDENGNETTPDISYAFDGRLGVNTFTTKTLSDLPVYPEKPTVEPSSGSYDLDPDLSFNIRVYALNKSRTTPKMIYMNNLYLIRVAYPDRVSFAFSDYGTDIGSPAVTYYPFQNYLQNNVNMNLSFQRANIDNVGSTNDNDTIVSNGVTIFDPNSTSYPSITHYQAFVYVVETKSLVGINSSSATTITGNSDTSKGMKNTSTTTINDSLGRQVVNSYGNENSPVYYQIMNTLNDLEQRDVSFQNILLPGTKYAIKLSAKNNNNPYYSHAEEAVGMDLTNYDYETMEDPYEPSVPVLGSSSDLGLSAGVQYVGYAGEFPSLFKEMTYFTNTDNFVPTASDDDPLYVKYITESDLVSLSNSTITFGGHRIVSIFDPTQTNNYRNIPYYNPEYSSGFSSGETGKSFDISGTQEFYINFNRQGINCVNQTLATAKLIIDNSNTSVTHTINYLNDDTDVNNVTNFIVHNGSGDIEMDASGTDHALSIQTVNTEAAVNEINYGFVQHAEYKIVPGATAGSNEFLLSSREIYDMYYEIEAPVTIDSLGTVGGYLDGISVNRISSDDRKYQFYIDNYNATPNYVANTNSITVDNTNLLYIMGIPTSKLVTLTINYTVTNYADQFLPAIEIDESGSEPKTMLSQAIINPNVISGNSDYFGTPQTYDYTSRKNYIGIDETYDSINNIYMDNSGVIAEWTNIYMKESYVPTSSTSLVYNIIIYHLSTTPSSTYDNVGLLSNEQTEVTGGSFTPDYTIWSDRDSCTTDSNGVITDINSELSNIYDTGNDFVDDGGSFIGSILDVTASDFSLKDSQLVYVGGRFVGPAFTGLDFDPYTNITLNNYSYIDSSRNASTTGTTLTLEGSETLKFVIFKVASNKQVGDSAYFDGANLLINGNNLSYYVGADGTWPSSLDGVYIWVSQEIGGTQYYGSVNKSFTPTVTSWYYEPNNTTLAGAYASSAGARALDNSTEFRFSVDDVNNIYLIVGINNNSSHYVNYTN